MTRWMTQDRWTAVACFAIAVLIIFAIPSQTSDRPLPGARGFDILDGAFFPKIAVALFIVGAIWLFIEARPGRQTPLKMPSDDGTPKLPSDAVGPPAGSGSASFPDDEPPGITFGDLGWAVALTGGMLIYVQFLDVLGYLLCTIIGVALLALVCGQRSPLGLFFGAVVFPAAIYYLFTRLFMVPLPQGFL